MNFFARQSKGFAQVLTIFGYFVGGIMAVGAVFAALNTMYAVVAAQSVFIATLRAMGFYALAVLSAVFLESLLLSAVGGALAGRTAIAWVLFGGHTLTMLTGSQSQMVFSIQITPALGNSGRSLGAGDRVSRRPISRDPRRTSARGSGPARFVRQLTLPRRQSNREQRGSGPGVRANVRHGSETVISTMGFQIAVAAIAVTSG